MLFMCSVYKTQKIDEMYLYVDKLKGLGEVPEALLQQFGKPTHVMDLLLKADRKLARVDVEEVMKNIQEQGFYLQMPPPPEES